MEKCYIHLKHYCHLHILGALQILFILLSCMLPPLFASPASVLYIVKTGWYYYLFLHLQDILSRGPKAEKIWFNWPSSWHAKNAWGSYSKPCYKTDPTYALKSTQDSPELLVCKIQLLFLTYGSSSWTILHYSTFVCQVSPTTELRSHLFWEDVSTEDSPSPTLAPSL